MERLEYDLLFRCFFGLAVDDDDAVWHHSTFSRNRDWPLAGDIGGGLYGLLAQPRMKRLLSGDRFSVDGKFIQA